MHNRTAAQSDPASKTLLQQREGIWNKIDSWLKSIPLRNLVLVAGDLNCGLFPEKTYIGRGVAYACQVPPDQTRLQQLVKDHELCALNTWKKKGAQAGTFLSSSGTCTQIDFILTRKVHTTPRARLAHARRDLPFIPITGMFHLPVVAEVSVKHDNRPAKQQTTTLSCLAHVRKSLEANPALATQFQDLFHKCRNEHANDVNAAMLQAWTMICPAKNAVKPLQACENTTSMIRALWQQRQQVRTSSQAVRHICHGSTQKSLLTSLFQHWKALSVHGRMTHALRQHCKIQKSRKIEKLVADAGQNGSSLTGLFGILRKIAPKTTKRRTQLRNTDGSLAEPTEQLNIIQGYFKRVYAADTAPTCPPHDPCLVSFEVEEIESAIQSLPNKALPTAFAAAPLWRLCAHTAAQEIFLELQALLSASQVDVSRWHRAQVVLIPKPGKPLSDPASLRPISLLPPHAKILAKLVCDRLKPLVQQAAQNLPQFAYLPKRQTADALDRAMAHICAIRSKRKASGTTIWTRHEGHLTQRCQGGITMSLDLEKAFDSISWEVMRVCLIEFGVPQDLMTLIMHLHAHARYCFSIDGQEAEVSPGQGIRQGCGMAPAIWTIVSLSLIKVMQKHAPTAHITVFADDILIQWMFDDVAAFNLTPTEVAGIFRTLRMYCLTVSTAKTGVLHSWWGSRMSATAKSHVAKIQGKRFFVVRLDGDTLYLPMVASHKYLGIVLSYKNYERLSLRYRLRQAWIAM